MSTNLYNPADHRIYPARWPMYRGKQLFRIIDERSEEGKEELLSVSHITGITPRSQKNVTMFKAESLVGYKKCQVGDIAANTMWTWQGAIGVSAYAGVVSPAYNVYRQNGDYYNPRFLDMLLRERTLVDTYHSISTGIRPSRLRLYPDEFLTIHFPVPAKDEQDQIVRYLDWKLSTVNKLIYVKKKKVSEYKELRKAVIDQGILRGFQRSKTKESGVYWLGEVPAEWEVLSLKRICKVNASISDTVRNMDDSEMVTFLPMENVSETGMIDCSVKKPLSEVITGFSSFAKGDVVVAKITPCFENGKGACLNNLDTDIGFGTTEFINLRPSGRVLSKYLYMITMTRPFRVLGEEVMTGSAGQKRVPVNYIKNFTLGIPSIEEQEQILQEIAERNDWIDKAIEVESKSIQLMQELRARMISDAVTGKIDVRDIEIPDYEYVADNSVGDSSEDEMEETNDQED